MVEVNQSTHSVVHRVQPSTGQKFIMLHVTYASINILHSTHMVPHENDFITFNQLYRISTLSVNLSTKIR